MFLWDAVISFLNESYLIFAISCFVNIAFYASASSKGEIFSYFFGVEMLLVVAGYPIFVLVFLRKKHKYLH